MNLPAFTFGGYRLVLAGLRLGWFWLAVGAAALALVLILYRYERKLVSRKVGFALLTLRVTAATALVAALFEPISARTYREALRGRVIVGVDLSESMATADPGRSPEERAKLAKTLGLGPTEPIDALPRREVVRRFLGGDWRSPIEHSHDVEVVGFARDATPFGSTGALLEILKSPSKADAPDGLTTDWNPVLERGLKEGDAPVVGVILLTDGRRNGGDGSAAIADKLASRGIPVYPVMIGSTKAPRDAAVAGVKAAERVSRGDTADIEVTLKIDGPAPGTEVPVTLDRPGASPMRKLVKVPADGSRPTTSFRVAMDGIGLQTLTAAVGPIDGDVRADNDRRSFSIEVTDDRAKVLLIDGEARWEFQYLRNALARDPHVTVESIVFRQPAGVNGGNTYPKELPPRSAGAKAKVPDPLYGYDVIVVGDVLPNDLSADDWARLEGFADARGGTLVLTSGPRSAAIFGSQEAARKLLPVTDPRPAPWDANATDPAHPSLPNGVAIAPHPSATAEAWPMLRFDAEPDKSRQVWANLPRLPFVTVGKAKPLASTLATVSGDDSAVAIAVQPYGLGKVLWIGTDATWRWRHRVGDVYHHRFWGQVVRWANATKLAVGNAMVRYGPTRPRVVEGVGVPLRAQFSDDAPGVQNGLLVAARVFKKGPDGNASGEAVAVVPLRPRSDQPRTFEAIAPPLPQGSYLIRLEVPQLGADAPKAEAPLEVSPRDTPERVELSADRDPLDRLATTTAGRVFLDSDAGELPSLLKARTLERVRTEETSLWDRPWALMLFFAVLSCEWILRSGRDCRNQDDARGASHKIGKIRGVNRP